LHIFIYGYLCNLLHSYLNLDQNTIVNYLQRDSQLLWLIKTLNFEKLYYTKISNLKVTFQKMIQCKLLDESLWKKCERVITNIEGEVQMEEPNTNPESQCSTSHQTYQKLEIFIL